MIKNAAGKFFVIGVFVAFCTSTVYGQSELIYSSNYDLEFTVGEESYSVQSRARVRDGSAIPIELGKYRLDIGISESSPGHYIVNLKVLEKTNGSWFEMNLDAAHFSGEDGVPVEFEWSAADMGINLAFVASGARQW